MSRLREFQRSTVSLEKSVFEDMLVRLEKMEQLEQRIKALESEILETKEKEKAKEAARILFCSKEEFEEWERQQGILVNEKHWDELMEYTENNPLAYAILKSQWLEGWWDYECKREEEYQRELRKQEEESKQAEEREQMEREDGIENSTGVLDGDSSFIEHQE